MTKKEFYRSERMTESFQTLKCVVFDAWNKYLDKEPVKGDSWRDMHISKLNAILNNEIQELKHATAYQRPKEIYEECLDVINMASMVAAKIKESENKDKK